MASKKTKTKNSILAKQTPAGKALGDKCRL